MRRNILCWVAIPALGFIACNESYNREAAKADELTSLQSPARKRVRTADLSCRVPDVLAAISATERLVVSLGGVVELSDLENRLQEQHSLPWSGDSIRQMKRYTPVATLTLRIPSVFLDSVVTRLTGMASFIDHRRLQDQDLTLQYERNALKNEVLAQELNNREAVHTKANKELELSQRRDALIDDSIDRKIDNLAILEQSAFSTITVGMFQPDVVDAQTVINPEKLSKADFGTAILDAFRNGAGVFRDFFLFLVQVWPLWILVAACWLTYRKYLRKWLNPQRG